MDSMYRYMMPNPYQRDPHMDYSPHYYQRPDAVPPLMYMNPTHPPEYWPTVSGYPYPPVACHGCCNHSHMPSHNAWRPPYPHFPPAYYPPFPNQYVPSLHCATEYTPVAYNNVSRDQHCCGCPNHRCSQKEQSSVKIEEEPEREEVNKSAAVAPFKFKNSPYPVIWYPTDHSEDKDQRRNLKNVSADASPNTERKTEEKQPGGWFGWYPFESNKSGSPMEKGEKIGGHDSDDGKGRLPFPLHWMPYMPVERGKEEPPKKNDDPKLSLEPVKDSGEKTGGQPCSVVKDIPVKEVKPQEENLSSTNKDSSIKDVTGSSEKLPKNDPKRMCSAPKSSKLPPVCLRVDPLPRRKETNKSSRSSSPDDKKKPEQVLSPPNHKKKPEVTHKESKEGKRTAKDIKVVDGNTSQEERSKNKNEENHGKEQIPAECIKSGDAATIVQSDDTGSTRVESEDKSCVKEEVKTPSKITLSEEDAAVIIQSAYRGYDIRRWEPIKKLKEIARVREQIANVSNLILALESSSDTRGDSKQRNIIAETIMSLLLKLDMIQGLHPSIREVRKSVVRELVSLQEKLDALISEEPKAPQDQEPVAAMHDEYALKETVDATSSLDSNKDQSDLVELCQNHLNRIPNEASEILEKMLSTKNSETEASKVPEDSGSAIEPVNNREEDEQNSQTGEHSLTKEDGVDSVLGCRTECSVPDVVDSLSEKDETESEQPLEMTGDLLGVSDAERGETDHEKQTDERGRDCTNSFDQLGVPLGEIDTKSDATEITNSVDGLLEDGCTSCGEFGTTKQVDGGSEPQSPKRVFSDIFESVEVADKNENPIAAEVADKKDNPIAEEESNVEDANNNTSEADSSVVEDASDMLRMKDFEAEQEPSKKSTNTDEKVAEEISSDISVSDQRSVEQRGAAEYEQVFEEEKQPAQNREHLLVEKKCKEECVEREGGNEEDNTPEMESVAAGALDQGLSQVSPVVRYYEMTNSDEKVMEENEKLRDMVEKLVKSGEEQLRVISSLSGRVKHLERKLSKKRKLKVKAQKGKKPASLKEWTGEVQV